MAKIYTTPDFDVTAYDIDDIITAVGSGDPDGLDPSKIDGWNGPVDEPEW